MHYPKNNKNRFILRRDRNGWRKSPGERLFNLSTFIIMIILMIVTLYPFWFSLISSLNSGADLARGPIFLWPREFSLGSWSAVLSDTGMLKALWVTASRTVIVTVVSILYTAMFAYAFSRSYLKGKKFYIMIGFASMYFSGGIIPSFMLMNWLGLYDNYLVYILPSLFGGFWNVIIFNANYKALPEALFESAKIDGASEFRIFCRSSFRSRSRCWLHLLYLRQLMFGMIMEQHFTLRNPMIYRRCNT